MSLSIDLIDACIIAAEATALRNPEGVLLPNPHYLSIVRVMGPWWYPRAKEALQLTLSTGLVYQPASVTAFSSAVESDIERYFVGADTSAEERLMG